MGHTESVPASAGDHCSSMLLDIEKMAKQKGSISIFGRCTTTRSLDSDYKFDMNGSSPTVCGFGMSGPVQLATGKDGNKYAVKSFNKSKLRPEVQSELQSEIEIFLSLDHPHIARLEQVYETDDEVHLVMEFLDGGEVFGRLLKAKSYTENRAACNAQQMLLAVAYLHAQNICHRDLKLENFIYEHQGNDHLKLIDFGFAKVHVGPGKMSKACGSVQYVAPEVLQQRYTRQADLWSLGVISHMLLTGSPVFRGSDDQMVKLIKQGQVRLSSRFGNLSAVAQDFVRSLLVVDPAKRLTAQSALEHPFIANRTCRKIPIDVGQIRGSLRKYAAATPFRRVCLSMMALSLSQEDRKHLWEKFLALDVQKKGTISLPQFKALLEEGDDVNSFSQSFLACINAKELDEIFTKLDTSREEQLCYSEFLAAELQDGVQMKEDLLRKTFDRFDLDRSGEITADNLHKVVGDGYDVSEVKAMIKEAETDGPLCREKFLHYFNFHKPAPGGLYAGDALDLSCNREGSGTPTACQRERTPNCCHALDKLRFCMPPGDIAVDCSGGSPLSKSVLKSSIHTPNRLMCAAAQAGAAPSHTDKLVFSLAAGCLGRVTK